MNLHRVILCKAQKKLNLLTEQSRVRKTIVRICRYLLISAHSLFNFGLLCSLWIFLSGSVLCKNLRYDRPKIIISIQGSETLYLTLIKYSWKYDMKSTIKTIMISLLKFLLRDTSPLPTSQKIKLYDVLYIPSSLYIYNFSIRYFTFILNLNPSFYWKKRIRKNGEKIAKKIFFLQWKFTENITVFYIFQRKMKTEEKEFLLCIKFNFTRKMVMYNPFFLRFFTIDKNANMCKEDEKKDTQYIIIRVHRHIIYVYNLYKTYDFPFKEWFIIIIALSKIHHLRCRKLSKEWFWHSFHI